MKVRIIKDYKDYKKDDLVDVTPNVAHGLIDGGYARIDRMFTPNPKSYKVKNG